MNLVIYSQGGKGKQIMLTAVIANYKKTYPESKIVVVSGFPEVFINNPHVYRNLHFSTPYLYQDYYGNPDWEVFAMDPYFHPDWIKNKDRHLIDIWSEMLEVDYLYDTPELYFSSAEVDELNRMIKTEKPIVFVQSAGGSNPAAVSWSRNPPLVEFSNFISKFSESHHIVHVCTPETPALMCQHERVENLNSRQTLALAYYSPILVGIDSYALHARMANKQAGTSVFFFPLEETINKLAYSGRDNTFYITPRPEITQVLKDHADYYSGLFKIGIETTPDSCPVPAGTQWFNTEDWDQIFTS